MAKFEFDEKFQASALALAVSSTAFLKAARGLIKPEYFEGKEQWTICSLAFRFFDEYGVAPRDYLANEVLKHCQQNAVPDEEADLIADALGKLDVRGVSERYVTDEIVRFARHEEMRRTLEEFLPKYNRGKYDLDELIEQANRVQKIGSAFEDMGQEYLKEVKQRAARRRDKIRQEFTATLIDVLDERFVGIKRTQLGTVLGPSGAGKSYMLTHLGKAGMFQRRMVFHYTGEMSVDEIADRYDRMVIGVTEEELTAPGTVKRLLRKTGELERLGGGLLLKYFDEDTSVKDLRRHIEKVRAERGISPDMVIVDYGELLDVTERDDDEYSRQGTIWRQLKTLATELDIPVWTATQATRGAAGAKRVTELQTADSYEKVRISDIFIGFNRNLVYDENKGKWLEENDEYNASTVRLHVIKHRGRPDKYDVTFNCDLDRGVFYSKLRTDLERERRATELAALQTKEEDYEGFD